MSIHEQLLFLLIAAAYLGIWWRAVRTVFGDRFVPVEWIPILILALGVPAFLLDSLNTPAWRDSEMWIIVPWASIPVPVIIGSYLRGRWRSRVANDLLPDTRPAPNHSGS